MQHKTLDLGGYILIPHYLELFRILLCFNSLTIDEFTLGRDGGNALPESRFTGVGGVFCTLAATPVTLTL
ncbi:MAG: hypothetical protein WAK17_04420 [Candidatus Nitrosopolaris sp.]